MVAGAGGTGEGPRDLPHQPRRDVVPEGAAATVPPAVRERGRDRQSGANAMITCGVAGGIACTGEGIRLARGSPSGIVHARWVSILMRTFARCARRVHER
jgi:hypothetical protein